MDGRLVTTEDRFVDPNDQPWNDDHKNVLLEWNARNIDSGSEFDVEDANFEGISVPDVGDGVQCENGNHGFPFCVCAS